MAERPTTFDGGGQKLGLGLGRSPTLTIEKQSE